MWFFIAVFWFSIIGDWFFSDMKNDSLMFVSGIGFFAHLGYLFFAFKNAKPDKLFTVFILAVFLIFYFVILYPKINEPVLLFGVLVYLLLSCFLLGAAFGLRLNKCVKWSTAFAIILILLSDTVI